MLSAILIAATAFSPSPTTRLAVSTPDALYTLPVPASQRPYDLLSERAATLCMCLSLLHRPPHAHSIPSTRSPPRPDPHTSRLLALSARSMHAPLALDERSSA